MADALAVAYGYLNRRERTVVEVQARLARVVEKGDCSQADADAAVAELIELGYLDDGRYARLFVEDKRTLESWGNERIQRVLTERGIARDTIAAAVAAADSGGAGESEADRAVALLRRRFPIASDEPRERERAFGMLIRKGYGSDAAAAAVRAWRRGEGA